MTLKSSKTLLAAAGLTAASLTLLSTANAAEIENRWTATDNNHAYVGEAFTQKRNELIGNGEFLYTTNDKVPGLLFSCINNKLQASVTTAPHSWANILQAKTKRTRVRPVSIQIGSGDKIKIGSFAYAPSDKTITTKTRGQAIRLYNAAIAGQTISIQMLSKRPTVLEAPLPNLIFANFGSLCGVGNESTSG